MNDLMNLNDIWNKTLDVLSYLIILVPVGFIAHGAYQGFKTPLICKNIRKSHGLELIINPNSKADISDDMKLTNIIDALDHEKKCALEVKIPYLSSTPGLVRNS